MPYRNSLRCRLLVAAVTALAITGCATQGPSQDVSAETGSFDVSFSYPGLGVGPQPISGLVLSEGLEARTASWAILDSAQALQLSVIEPKLDASSVIPPGTRWSTDIVPLAQGDIAAHNQRFPNLALAADRLYGLQYAGEYAIQNKELRFRVDSVLYERGAASNFRRYEKGAYSGQFFFERLKLLIIERLPAAAKAEKR